MVSQANFLNHWARVGIMAGLAVVIAGILGMKVVSSDEVIGDQLPQEQLDVALAAGQPTLAFFHSMNCDPCIAAMRVVEEVYPAYEDSIVLVDVNVSETANHPLLRRIGVRTIPAFFIYDRSGEFQIFYGVPQPDQLRTVLTELGKDG